MATLNRWLLAVFAGLAISIVVSEAAMALHALLSGPPLLPTYLLSGAPVEFAVHAQLMGIWVLATVPGGAMAAALGRMAALGLLVGLGCGAALAFTALVGGHPNSTLLALGLVPVLGSLIGIRIAQHLRALDGQESSGRSGTTRPGL